MTEERSPARRVDRRQFLAAAAQSAAAAGVLAIHGCNGPEGGADATVIPSEPLALLPSGKLLDTDFPDPFAGGECLGYLPFVRENSNRRYVPGKRAGKGHDARLCIDPASLLMPPTRITPVDAFYIRTEYPDKLRPPAEWTIKIHGHVKRPQDVPLKSLLSKVDSRGAVLLECAGNARELGFGLLSVADWNGIPIEKLIDFAQPTSRAQSVYINGFDEHTAVSTHSSPTCSWIFTLDQLVRAKAFFATEINGGSLTKDHGAPLRLVVPGWYGCAEMKWINEIKFVDNDQPVTPQMTEFAMRTLQSGNPTVAREYEPATIDQAMLPVRVEKWKLDDAIAYRIIGITWGGPDRTDKLKIRCDRNRATEFDPVLFASAKTSIAQYGIWMHRWVPRNPGIQTVQVRVAAPGVRSRKQERGHYDRAVVVPSA